MTQSSEANREGPCSMQEQTNDVLFSKIQMLRNEMQKENSDYFEIKPVYDLLEQVLSEKESIALSPKDVIGDETRYYLKYLDEISTGEKRQRIIEFGSKDKVFTTFYIQSWDNNGLLILQKLHQSAINNKRFPLISCNTFLSDNRYYIVILTKINDSDIEEGAISLLFYNYEYDGLKWIRSDFATNKLKKGNWEEHSYASAPGLYEFRHNQANRLNGEDYEIKMTNNKVDIALVDKNKKIIDTIEVVFQNGRWGIK